MINYNDLKTNLIINNVPSDELLMKMAEENKLEPNQIYQTPDNSSEVNFIGEGGSSVEINSTDTPVGIANFIKVDGLNYKIGGVGGSSLELLWTNPNPTSEFVPQTLSLNLSNYDYFIIKTRHFEDYGIGQPAQGQINNDIVFKNDELGMIKSFYITDILVEQSVSWAGRSCIISDTEIVFGDSYYKYTNTVAFTTKNNNTAVPIQIYGVKSGSSVVSSNGITQEVLWENQNTSVEFSAQNITLNDSVYNYDYILIDYLVLQNSYGSNGIFNTFIKVKEEQINYMGAELLYVDDTKNAYVRKLSVIDANIIQVGNCTNNNNWSIPYKIYGIKVGSGGGSVESIYPVGSLYMSINETSPAELFGGTWEQISSNATILTSSSAPVGITDVGIPSGYHLPNGRSIGDGFVVYYGNYMATGFYDKNTKQYTGTYSGADTSFSLFTDLSENSLSGIYIWKRIA